MTALDREDPRIAEGLRISGVVLSRAQQTADGRGAKFIVLLIPTKELVYADLMQHEGKLNGTYARLVEMENRARHEVDSWCTEKRIRCVDALPNLQRAIAGRQQIYPSTTESHPNAAGYRVRTARPPLTKALGNWAPLKVPVSWRDQARACGFLTQSELLLASPTSGAF